jgi:hypothetical protein
MLDRYVDVYEEHVQSAIERYFRISDEPSFVERLDCSYKEFAEQIVQFSLEINRKANELLTEGSSNESVNTSELQKKLFEIGKSYIRTFTDRHKKKNLEKDRLQNHRVFN